jgi:hypothetical protein
VLKEEGKAEDELYRAFVSVVEGEKFLNVQQIKAPSEKRSWVFVNYAVFVDCQMFFDFKKAPNLKAALKAEIEPDEFKLQLTSQTFPVRGYKRIAVKVVDVYGNESTVVRAL